MNKNISNKKADLHIHSIYSDGIYTPKQLVNKAIQHKITKLSITDHDNIKGFYEAAEYAANYNIEVIPGIELSAYFNRQEVHILGYFIDVNDMVLNEHINKFKEYRTQRAKIIINKLNEIDVNVSFEDILLHDLDDSSIGRPHIANALINKGYAANFFDAFNKYIGEDKPAYVPKWNITVESALDIISNAGGLSFLAHPGKHFDDNVLVELVQKGFDGIEVIHPSHTKYDISKLSTLADQFFLLKCGGSDYHGDRVNDNSNFGKYFIDENKFSQIKKRYKINYVQKKEE